MKINIKTIKNISVDNVQTFDYPDFVDAYIMYAEHADGTKLTESELDFINDEHCDFVQEQALESFI